MKKSNKIITFLSVSLIGAGLVIALPIALSYKYKNKKEPKIENEINQNKVLPNNSVDELNKIVNELKQNDKNKNTKILEIEQKIAELDKKNR